MVEQSEVQDMEYSKQATPIVTSDSSARATGKTEIPAALVTECDVAEGIPPIAALGVSVPIMVLVRIFSEPVGVVNEILPANGMCPDDLSSAIVRKFEPQLRERFSDCGLEWNGHLPTRGLHPLHIPRFMVSRDRVMRDGPEMTIAVCTRNRPKGLAVTLETLANQEYKRMRLLVVDNAPSNDQTRQVVLSAARKHQVDVSYAAESRPGLSWARNRAIEASDTEVIAFVDDDERCDRWFAAEIARGFVEVPEAGAVTGAVVSGELATRSQALYEEYSGIRRGRGFARWVFSPATAHVQSPLYPLPPFGAGGNMAFRRNALEQIGRFDCALGAGTLTHGGEDTAALSALLIEGGTIVYQPTAIVWHRYGRDYPELRRQLRGYGRGLSSFYMSMLLRRPRCAAELLRLSGRAARDQFSHRSGRLSELGEDFPRDLLRANRIGLLEGPLMYAAARIQARRLRRGSPVR